MAVGLHIKLAKLAPCVENSMSVVCAFSGPHFEDHNGYVVLKPEIFKAILGFQFDSA